MLAQPHTSESQILSALPNKVTGTTTHKSKMPIWTALHDTDATKAYEFDKRWTPGTKFGTGLAKHTISGYAMDKEHTLSSASDLETRYQECCQELRNQLEPLIRTTDKHCAFAVSFHYTKLDDNKRSAHTTGFFFSRGKYGTRSLGYRFFDPNTGSWKFASLDELLNFALGDWLRNFVDGTVNPDPGHVSSRRILNYYRLVMITH
jgi:hypothetical protein